MSDNCVMLVLKPVIYESKLLIFKTSQALFSNIINQTLENADFMDRH